MSEIYLLLVLIMIAAPASLFLGIWIEKVLVRWGRCLKAWTWADGPCRITHGGGMLFTDDLLTCATCGRQAYPESFACPKGRPLHYGVPILLCDR